MSRISLPYFPVNTKQIKLFFQNTPNSLWEKPQNHQSSYGPIRESNPQTLNKIYSRGITYATPSVWIQTKPFHHPQTTKSLRVHNKRFWIKVLNHSSLFGRQRGRVARGASVQIKESKNTRLALQDNKVLFNGQDLSSENRLRLKWKEEGLSGSSTRSHPQPYTLQRLLPQLTHTHCHLHWNLSWRQWSHTHHHKPLTDLHPLNYQLVRQVEADTENFKDGSKIFHS